MCVGGGGYLLLGARRVGPNVEHVSARLQCGVGLGPARRAGWDDTQHLLLNHTCGRQSHDQRGQRAYKKGHARLKWFEGQEAIRA